MVGYTPVAKESRDVLPSSHDENTSEIVGGIAWEPGFWRQFPGRAFAALVVATIMAACMGVILALADGKPAPWRVSPTVLLAAVAAAANALGRYALVEGAAIAWWKKACSPGTLMENLHHSYSFGQGLGSIVRYFTAFNFVALASLAVSLLPINGILLQRAITIHAIDVPGPINMTIDFAQRFPDGYTGILTSRSDQVDLLTTNFTRIVQDLTSGTTQNISTNACGGRCTGAIQAAGYAIKCRENKTHIDISTPVEHSEDAPIVFSSSFDYTFDGDSNQLKHAQMNFSAAFKDIDTCVGDLQIRNCTLEPALLRQRVVLVNNTIGLDPAYDYTSDEVLQSPILVPDKTTAESGSQGTYNTHGGMALYLMNRFTSEAVTEMDGIYGLQVFQNGFGGAYMDYMTDAGRMGTGDARCNIKWRDPTPNMMATVRELAFRTAHKAADPQNTSDVVFMTDGVETRNKLVYKSDFEFLGLALMVTFLGLICVLPTFTGWWSLGRRVSMNPLEIAKAFNGVRMEHAESNANVDRLLMEVGKEPIRYGVVMGNKLMMGHPDEVSEIPRGSHFR